MKYIVGDMVRIRKGSLAGNIYTISHIESCGYIKLSDLPYFFFDYELEPAYAGSGYVPYRKIPTPSKQEILKFTNAFPKEEEKMSTKFTFYVKEGTRPDKKCNGLIPTMTTTVVDASGKKATVTCDKADYSERQGVLEAIAQMACGGNFDKEYDKAVKKNKLIELHDRTCIYCGKVFDTVEELKAHEAWHVECKKARRKRYLLRKRAKEIAFEEQAQKMAREIIAEDNKK